MEQKKSVREFEKIILLQSGTTIGRGHEPSLSEMLGQYED